MIKAVVIALCCIIILNFFYIYKKTDDTNKKYKSEVTAGSPGLELIEQGICGTGLSGQRYIIVRDKESGRRILYVGHAAVVLPEKQ